MDHPKKTKFDVAVADKVREMRLERGLTQRYIANALGVSAGFIGQVESINSETKYSVSQLNRLAKEFDCSPKDFIPDTYIQEDDWMED
jgi:transcriptional regulator with XRE-family HTH domain